MRDVDKIRQSIWDTLIEPAISDGKSRVVVTYDEAVEAARAVGLEKGRLANVQGAIEQWNDDRIRSIEWTGRRCWPHNELIYRIHIVLR